MFLAATFGWIRSTYETVAILIHTVQESHDSRRYSYRYRASIPRGAARRRRRRRGHARRGANHRAGAVAESAAPGVVFYSAAAAVRSDGGGSVEPRVPRGSPTDSRPPLPAAAAADCTLDVTNCLRNGRHLARRPPSPVSLSPRPSGCPARTAIYQIPTQMIHLTPVKHAGYPIRGTESSFVLLLRLYGSPTNPLQFRPDVSLLPSTISHSIFLYTIH